MIAEGREIAKIHPNMVVKIPMTAEGLKAVKVLSAEGIKTNVTPDLYGKPGSSGCQGLAHPMFPRSWEDWMIFQQMVPN